MKRAAVFLDRDGTINEQMGYINHISRFHLLDGAAKAIRSLNEADIPVVVVTNQSGLARGYFPVELLEQVHLKMNELLIEEGARIDGLFVCPHHRQAKREEFRKNCNCRKPKTGLLEQAALEMNIDLDRSFMVGDRFSDIRCGASAGTKTILVLTGYGRGDLKYIKAEEKVQPDFIAENLSGAVSWILGTTP
jgi:D-glycero-D-manno-heptose 1,7-bisphosphate phosphatase